MIGTLSLLAAHGVGITEGIGIHVEGEIKISIVKLGVGHHPYYRVGSFDDADSILFPTESIAVFHFDPIVHPLCDYHAMNDILLSIVFDGSLLINLHSSVEVTENSLPHDIAHSSFGRHEALLVTILL